MQRFTSYGFSIKQQQRFLSGNPRSVVDDKPIPVDRVEAHKIFNSMLGYVWPHDEPGVKLRVVGALGLLVAAKVRSAFLERHC